MAVPRPKIQRIAIIGAGASGISSAKALLAEDCFQTIDILEQRGEPCGVWNYTSEYDIVSVTSTDPSVAETPVVGSDGGPVFVSAAYDGLETNTPKQIMSFEGFSFPDDVPLYPSHTAVRKYLEEYSKELRHLITFNVKVIDCRKNNDEWEVRFKDTRTESKEEKRVYDAVLVAAGHYNMPYIPSVPGLEEWAAKYKGSITHSKSFRKPNKYLGKKVIVVGNAASGFDLGAQICQYSQRPLLRSCRTAPQISTAVDSTNICEVSEISAFSVTDRTISFSDGTIVRDVDDVIFCTNKVSGYLHSLPFLSSLNTGSDALITDGMRVHRVYQYIFYIPDPTLSFVGLPIKVMPFPVAQLAGGLIARVWAGRATLPSETEMRSWEAQQVQERGNGREFHYLQFPKDADYMDLLRDLCKSAAGENKMSRMKLPRWGEEERWTRARLPLIRGAYSDMKTQGIFVKTKEELGFDRRYTKDDLGVNQGINAKF